MTQKEYLGELECGLAGRLPDREIREITEEYQGFFVDGLAEGRTEDEISESLGSPARLARSLTEEADAKRTAPGAPPAIDNTVASVNSFVNKKIDYPLATLGQRIGAALIDKAFLLVMLIACYVIFMLTQSYLSATSYLSAAKQVPVISTVASPALIDCRQEPSPAAESETAGAVYAGQTSSVINFILLIFLVLTFLLPNQITGIILIILNFISTYYIHFQGNPLLFFTSFLLTMLFALYALYKPLTESMWNGRTIGKRIAGIRVASENGGKVSIGNIWVRELVGDGLLAAITGGVTTIVSIFTVAVGRTRKSVPDYIASTIVVVDYSKTKPGRLGRGTKL